MKIGGIQHKILILLASGAALGLSTSPKSFFKIITLVGKEWQSINRYNLRRAIAGLYENRLITVKERSGKEVTLTLTDTGRRRVLSYKFDEMTIARPEQWDKKWRIVLFDIPEHQKKIRDAFRHHLKRLSFFELQKSVFVHPYECKNEIDFLIEFYQARRHIRFVIAHSIDNELHLKEIFHIR
ncbi:MAG: CRISPR-associated endonuclease Cas2 [Candidatus Sungbacteria bacterium RIFCSPLOWO2_02_FULL_51_17]|uniref:CRISPR-associated endonuclease Cas2 n=1 Tax=Candidatus Sungbacteria bacterium RIFCSPHIGHO2_02_FULL_51_29 TaxID=1802273 RepID=A0A1G2KVT7_9BACT|nr:MAG: CRISPR-associated endonuclease Cas2 [Candidatus Sungbacteria bacterium RIFCSPHIGHO2_01_FULL_51_22]OHA03536.1 MAG: CRISPR-associated endonuclease Cas2 [Candidatus Sungbacteria bacterium RIFCSPHIGHO2_02_FULL_51_29]OHA10769.1 MAG: CRISPR-associated endonuclease Cas2 [Candidatus Sungbacteria bacterium RIFCSPLOWO2_02_FULL_51_17]